MSYDKHGRGVIASLLVHADLIKKGYQVFIEDTSQGLIDMVAVHIETGEIKLIDVKCISKRENGSMVYRILSDNQRSFEEKTGQKIDIVYADTDTYEVKYSSRREKRKKVQILFYIISHVIVIR